MLTKTKKFIFFLGVEPNRYGLTKKRNLTLIGSYLEVSINLKEAQGTRHKGTRKTWN
jgi:hypothetical protein